MAGGIILQWKDRNFSEEQHRIYKSTSPMTLGMLPTPIATLGSNITEYIDYDVIEGNTYYYRISAVRGNDEAVSDELMMVAEEMKLGPGSDILIAGDMTAGFFGEVPVTELITGDELATSIGLTQGTAQFSNEPWLKFVLDDNIIYVAKKPYRHTLTWQSIYQSGAVYGTGDNGYNPSVGNRIQDANIVVDGFSLDVTLLKGANSDPALYSGGWDVAFTHNSEWNRLMYPIHSGIHTDNRNPSNPSVPYAQWATYSDNDLIMDYRVGDGSLSWTQETPNSNTSNRLARGRLGVTYVDSYAATSTNSTLGWRPALRLVL